MHSENISLLNTSRSRFPLYGCKNVSLDVFDRSNLFDPARLASYSFPSMKVKARCIWSGAEYEIDTYTREKRVKPRVRFMNNVLLSRERRHRSSRGRQRISVTKANNSFQWFFFSANIYEYIYLEFEELERGEKFRRAKQISK